MHFLTFYEQTQHGTPEFPAEYHYLDLHHPRYNMPFHWHKEWEIIYVLQGTFPVYADGILHTAHAGEMLLIRDGMLHGGTPNDCIYECFLFDLQGLFRNQELVKKYLRPIYHLELLPRIHYTVWETPEVLDVILELLDAYHRLPTDLSAQLSAALSAPSFEDTVQKAGLHELATVSAVSKLFLLILQNGYYTQNNTEVVSGSRKTDQIKSVLEYIESNFASPITLEVLADRANMNPRYFCRYFHSITHQTPLDYVNSYRIERASQLLLETDRTVTDIGMECGFNDGSYFVKVFRKYRGLTPSRYRRSNR